MLFFILEIMSGSTAVQIRKLLQRTGYIQQIIKDGSVVFANGPTGALLRQNIFRTWYVLVIVIKPLPTYWQISK